MKISLILLCVMSFRLVVGDYATETTCKALDRIPRLNNNFSNRAEFVTIDGKSYCWRSTGSGDFFQAITGKECQEFKDGQFMDLSNPLAEFLFQRALEHQGGNPNWLFWVKGEQTGTTCPYYKFGTGITRRQCTDALVYYCAYPAPTVDQCIANCRDSIDEE